MNKYNTTILDKICNGVWHRRAREGLLPELCRRRSFRDTVTVHHGGAGDHHNQEER